MSWQRQSTIKIEFEKHFIFYSTEKGAPEDNDVCGPQGPERGSTNCFVQVFNVTKGNVSVCICNDLANHNHSPTSHRKSIIIMYIISVIIIFIH